MGTSNLAGVSVLLVEDDEIQRVGLSILLKILGATVSEARDSSEALEQVARSTPRVILSDVCMPGMDGFEFLASLRATECRCRIPVVAMTGASSRVIDERIQTAGFAGHLTKPIKPEDLGARILDVLKRPS